METPPPNTAPFDAMSKNVFQATVAVMGYTAIWTPAGGGSTYTAQVHFNNPTSALEKFGIEFNPDEWRVEYYAEDFPGLKDLADERGSNEVLNVAGVNWHVRTVVKKWDGKTYVVDLQKMPV